MLLLIIVLVPAVEVTKSVTPLANNLFWNKRFVFLELQNHRRITVRRGRHCDASGIC